MGKLEEETAVVVGEPPAPDCCCSKSTWRWLIPSVLGVYLLALALWSIRFRGSSDSDSQPPPSAPWMPHIEASFRLRRSVSAINESLSQLQADLQDEIGIPDTQIDIVSMVPLPSTNWTEVSFTVSPDTSNDSIAPAEMSLLKDTLVELFMQRSANLSLTNNIFGKVSHFEVLNFPGGITVVPQQPGFPLSKVLVLFNFTLHNSLSHINNNFEEFKEQLAKGIVLKPNEILLVQLTNLEGSTLKLSLVVQTSILPVVGVFLSTLRLKQLAQEISTSPRKKNLGLNHTLFGRVKKIELSSYLQCSLEPAKTPSPSPSPAPSSPPDWPPGSRNAPSPRGSRGHQRHSPVAAPSDSPHLLRASAPTSEGIAAAPHHQHHHHRHKSAVGLAPSIASHPSAYLSHSPLSSPPSSEHSSGYRAPSEPPSQSSPATAPSDPGKSHLPKGPSPAYGSFVKSPKKLPTSLKAPSEAPQGFAPRSVSGPLESHERIAFVPVASPTSSAFIFGVPSWVMVVLPALLVGFW